MSAPTELSLGTHNLHDSAGLPTPFADVILFTEAVPRRIRDRIALARKGYQMHVCKAQRDLVVLTRRKAIKITSRRYRRAHAGKLHFTPNRGTYVLRGRVRATGQPLAILNGHRINAAFPPYRFPESDERRNLRRALWTTHEVVDEALVDEVLLEGRTVLAGGDGNRRNGAQVWPATLRNLGTGTDRLAVSGDVAVLGVSVLSKAGSDHPRLKAVLRLWPRTNDRPHVEDLAQ